jgi:outer membrane protein TolC
MRKIIILFSIAIFSFSMTLEQTIDIAIKNSPSLQAKKIAIKMQKEQKKAVKAKSYGDINVFSSYTHYNIPRTLKPLVPPISPTITLSKDITSVGGSYNVAIFKGFADLAQIEIAKLSTLKSDIDYKLTKEELIYNIKALYYKALGLKSLSKSLETHITALKKTLEYTKKEVELGKKAPLDILKIKSQLLKIKSAKVSAINAVEAIKSHISALIDSPFDDFTTAYEKLKKQSNTPLIIKESLIQSKKSQKELKKAKSLYYPKLFLETNYIKNYAKGEDEEVWQGGLKASYTLFDFGYKSHTYQKAYLGTLIAKKNLKVQQNLLKSKIEDTMLQIKSIKAKIDSIKADLKLLAKIEEIEKIKYQNSRSTIEDYLQAIANTKEAEANLAKNRYELYTKFAYINYLKADK